MLGASPLGVLPVPFFLPIALQVSSSESVAVSEESEALLSELELSVSELDEETERFRVKGLAVLVGLTAAWFTGPIWKK